MSQAQALIFSIAVEAVAAFALLRLLRWGGGLRGALAATVGTLVTHPLAWALVLRFEASVGYAATVAAVETGVVVAESLAYRVLVPLGWRRALAASLFANAASTLAALALYRLRA